MAEHQLNSYQIIEVIEKHDKSEIFESIKRLYLKIYGAAIGNFLAHHMCLGGIYLVGSITNSLLNELNGSILDGWYSRHMSMKKANNEVPLLVCK